MKGQKITKFLIRRDVHKMNKTILLFILVSTSQIFAMYSNAQALVTGTVCNTNGEVLIGVNVTVIGQNTGTITDVNGRFTINVPTTGSIKVSYIGYQTQEVKVENKRDLMITLEENSKTLEEVVVVGYGSFKKSDLTGSVGSVRISDLEKAPVVSFDQALAGRIAGVQVTSNDGQPGSVMDIVIRGGNSLNQSNAPLYVIDGFPMEDNLNLDINPDDIESINILKDASATAVYGARAANGVVIIETKKGKISKPIVTFKASMGTENVTKRMDLMEPYEFVKYVSEWNAAYANLYYFNEGKTLDMYKGVQGFDWQDRVLKTALVQNYSAAVRGGKDDIKYAVSGSVNDQKGVIINSGFKRYQGNASLDISLRKNVKLFVNTALSQSKRYGSLPSNTSAGVVSSAVMYSVWGYRPITSGMDYSELEEMLTDPTVDSANDYRVNPVLNLSNQLRETTSFNSRNIANLVYRISKSLVLKINGGINKKVERVDVFNNSNTSSGTPTIPSNTGKLTHGSVCYNEANVWTNENILTYTKRIKRIHSINAMLGTSLQHRDISTYGLSAILLPNESLGLSGLDEGTPSTVTASTSYSRMASAFSRLSYDYKSKYLTTVTFRADASSKFAKQNRWGYFPSGAFAWRFSEESLFKQIDFLSNGKLRTSYGLTGNNRVPDFAYLASLGFPITVRYSFNNGTPVNGVIPTEMGNEGLRWETTAQSNIGLDLGFFGNRIDLTLDFYQKITSDLLLYADLSNITGFPSVYNNIGKISNTGIEITLNTVNIKKRNFEWLSNFNISFNKNKILDLGVASNMLSNISWDKAFDNTPLYTAQVGQPAALFYGYLFDGVYQYSDFDVTGDGKYVLKADVPTNGNTRETIQPGDIKYKDLVGDDLVVNADDRTVIGNPNPLHTGGLSNNFRYKNLTLGIFFQWSYGNDIYNANRIIFEGNGLSRGALNQFATYQDRWTPENPSNTLYRTNGQGPRGVYSSRVIEDGSYIRLKTLSLSYDLPSKWIKALSFKDIKVSMSAQNLFTWTKYSGMDPEVSVRNTILTPGFDYSAYPRARTLVFEISASL